MSAVSSATTVGSSVSGSVGQLSNGEDAEKRFLTLLTAQLKNQDPLNPLDNAQVTSQLAQLSTVTGVSKLNETLGGLKAGLESSSAVQASNLIGKTVLAPTEKISLTGSAIDVGVKLTGPADKVEVQVIDANGATVKTLDLGRSDGGVLQAKWDGRLADGSVAAAGEYTVKATASVAGAPVGASALAMGKVQSVAINASGAVLQLADNRSVAVGQVSLIN